MVVPTVGAVGRGGGAAAGHGAEVALFGSGVVGAAMFRLFVMEGADGADWMVVLADRCGVPLPLAVAAACSFVGGVRDFDFPFTGEEENMRAHLLTLFGGGSDHHREGVFEGASIGVWVEEPSRGDPKAFGIEDSGFEINEQPFGVIRKVTEGQAVNGELILVGGMAEGEPGGVTDWEGFVEASRKGGEEIGRAHV